MKKLLAILTILPALIQAQTNEFAAPKKGFTSWQPAAGWEHGLLSGNGEMGALVIGQPHDETIILSHALLYLPKKRSEKMIDQASRLGEIRKLLLEGKYNEAAKIPVELRQQQGYHDERDPFIPAFDIRIQQEPSNIKAYQRSVNYETGEAIVDWQNELGKFQRKVFVSRADSMIVLSIKGTARINCTISFEKRPVAWNQQAFVNAHVKSMSATAKDDEWLAFQSEFAIKNAGAIHGYEGWGRVVAPKGRVTTNKNSLVVKDAEEVMVLIRIRPLYNIANQDEVERKRLTAKEASYEKLLAAHRSIHSLLFNKVFFQLDAEEKDRKLHTEEILLKSKRSLPLALIEKTFDAGRYNIISSTGVHPPNLQGIWSGTWQAPWAGSMTNDGNLPVAISMLLPGNTPELMHAFFNYHEKLMPDYRKASGFLYNTNGIHIPAQATTTGLDTDFGANWCLTFWTGAAGWAANYYWDFYQYTLDSGFLRSKAYPFMKEAALFYEDFLEEGTDGKLIFNPSYSPENTPSNSNAQAAVNATMDVMIAKQLLRNCIEAAEILKIDPDKRRHWRTMFEKMPAYQVAKDGTLREWLWRDLEENHEHRHASQLYALFDEVEPEFINDEKLRTAASKVIEEKMKFRLKEGGGEMSFGLVQLGTAAAHLGDSEKAYQLLQWLASRYWASGMASYHNVDHLFNTDISGGLPYLVSQMLVYSTRGSLSLLPAMPSDWKIGKIGGLLLRGNIELKNLEWNENRIWVQLQSAQTQNIKLHLPIDAKITGAKESKLLGRSGKEFELNLRGGESFSVEFEKTPVKK